MGKSKKKVWENFGGGVKKILGGQFLEKFQKKNLGGILGGKFMLGGVWWGRNAGKFKKKEFCKKTVCGGGGEFVGKWIQQLFRRNCWGGDF